MFVLLDDRDATAQRPSSRLYTQFAGGHRCEHPRTLDAVWTHVDADLRRRPHAVLIVDCEWGAKQAPGRGGEESAALRGALPARLRHTVVFE